jgi:hypothetical protein
VQTPRAAADLRRRREQAVLAHQSQHDLALRVGERRASTGRGRLFRPSWPACRNASRQALMLPAG